ncbi:hypothetical protein CALCODRAFT_420094, partial [Calocera cornea HHB12733]
LRSEPYVPDILGPTIPKRMDDASQSTDWYRAMVILFKPWRNLRDLIITANSWSDAYNAYEFSAMHRAIMRNMDAMNQAKEARD